MAMFYDKMMKKQDQESEVSKATAYVAKLLSKINKQFKESNS